MKYCGNCGAQLEDDQVFCDKCGTKVETFENQDEQTVSMFTGKGDNEGKNDFSAFPPSGVPDNGFSKEGTTDKINKKNTGMIIGIVATVLIILMFIGMYAEKYAQNRTETDDLSITYEKNSKEPEKEIVFSKGVVLDTTYESEFLNLRFTVPEGWVFRTNDEILEIFGSDGADQMEMSVLNLSSGENIHLITEPIPSKNATLEQYKDALKENFGKAGMMYIKDLDDVVIADKSYEVMDFDILKGTAIVKTRIYIRIQGDRLVYFMTQFLSGNEANVQPVLESFENY